ncbi:MAG TPA: glucoamylase family protein [Terriglobia bacterium]|nr:glucoamylase family protein [Terriglobia bacterium]
MELPLDSSKQLHQVSPEFHSAWLQACGARQARKWIDAGAKKRSKALRSRWKNAQESLERTFATLQNATPEQRPATEQERWVLDNGRFVRLTLKEVRKALKSLGELRSLQRQSKQDEILPRAYEIARGFLLVARFKFEEAEFGNFVDGVQQIASLEMRELWGLKPLLQLVLLERLGTAAEQLSNAQEIGSKSPEVCDIPPSRIITSLREISEMEWKDFFEAKSVVDRLLRSDPSGAYPWMDFESCELYRSAIAKLVRHTRLSEAEVARRAILCARRAGDPKLGMSQRATERRSNVGYYLLDHGVLKLKRIINYRPSLKQKIKDLILEWPEVYYVAGVEATTLVAVYLLLRHLGTVIPLIPALLLLIPASQAAVGLMNHLTSWLLRPRQIPRLDFSEGIPDEFSTLVVVPSMLLNEGEVRHIVESLEIRYLGNRDPNLQFALLTDSPDSSEHVEEHDDLVELCGSLIRQLNAKYAGDGRGSFFHFHRHRVYNARENKWMGWERKRGKLLDLNKYLLGQEDNFPVKVGDLSVLPRVRYVITLDSDTRLPRDAAYKLIGSMAHPLNRAVIDKRTNTVVEGYGIMQPRVGVSVESARKSRLASIYSGETGIDIYTFAISDVYQDLFGEGSFTGKGIYEVDTFQRVLGNRFPSNALLSHDLIEGIYGRTGLASDIEVIDDYPSHFSAYSRRMHRWVRGDWQILHWLFPTVPNFLGRSVRNPITLLSRWKIFDNLRRSLIELNLFLLLLAGWFVFPGSALYWTVLILALLLAPTYVQAFFSLLRIEETDNLKGLFKERANAFITGHLQVFVMLVVLPHKAFVMLDAIIRTLARLTFTHKNLLEWETAAEAEAGTRKKTAVEVYLAITPWFALAVGLSLAFVRPSALAVAAPILCLWLLSGIFTQWINRPPLRRRKPLTAQDTDFLRLASLTTWRYFREFSSPVINWLIPDRVQEMPAAVVHIISPTNLGILLNARLAAHELGYLTLTEFVQQTEATISSAKQLPRFRGHFLNWYDAQALQPLPPKFVSTVDSGNLAACLWTLKQACSGLLKEPIFDGKSWRGIRDHLSLLQHLLQQRSAPPEVLLRIQNAAVKAGSFGEDPAGWFQSLANLENEVREIVGALSFPKPEAGNVATSPTDELDWWLSETLARIEGISRDLQTLLPWLLPEFGRFQFSKPEQEITLDTLPSIIPDLISQLNGMAPQSEVDDPAETLHSLRSRLEASLQRATELSERLRHLAAEADDLLNNMDFRFLYDRKRKLLRIGYDIEAHQLANSSYDLLGSEARTATFIAIAKGDVGQEAWFHLGRARTVEQGEVALVSWSGTMFEYLMPLLWMRSYSGTLLHEGMLSAVTCQQKYARKRKIPWGISETAFNALDEKGIYQYAPFGIPGLAVNPDALKDLVVAPYASFLALLVDPFSATRNLTTMWEKGWFGRYGFYESADYSNVQTSGRPGYELIRCWMAHHQGMSLLAVCNLLTHLSLQRWFHQEPRVMATELLLHEKIPFAAPEEVGMSRPSQRPRQSPTKKTNSWKTLKHITHSGPTPEAPPPASEVSLELKKPQPSLNSEVVPPQV